MSIKTLVLSGLAISFYVFGATNIAPCPTDILAFEKSRDLIIDSLNEVLLTPEASSDLPKEQMTRLKKEMDFLISCIDKKPALKKNKTRLTSCFRRLRNFINASLWFADRMSGRSFGYDRLDAQYLKETAPYTSLPDVLKDSPLLSELHKNGLSQKAIDLFAQENKRRASQKLPAIKYVPYQSELPTADWADVTDKLLIYYPDPPNKRELWIQIGLTEPHSLRETRQFFTLSMVQSGSHHQGYVRPYEKRWDEKTHRAQVFAPPRNAVGDSCIGCHLVERPLPIHNVKSGYEKVGNELNQRMKEYNVTPSPYSLRRFLGPALGTADLERPDAFFETCTAAQMPSILVGDDEKVHLKQKEVIFKKLRSVMNCASCHVDGKEQPPINPPFQFMIERAIKHRRMPDGLGEALNPLEREMLISCLTREYFGGVFQKYMGEISCSAPPADVAAPRNKPLPHSSTR